MANYTEHLGLKKPLPVEYFSIDDFNHNFDVIDAEIGKATSDIGKQPLIEVLGILKGVGEGEVATAELDDYPQASLDEKGIVQLSTDVASDSHTTAATSGALKKVHDLALEVLELAKEVQATANGAVKEVNGKQGESITLDAEDVGAAPASLGATVAEHASDTDIHVSTAEKGGWNNAVSSLSTHTSDTAVHVNGTEKGNWNGAVSNLNTHTSNATVHVTSTEKGNWNTAVTTAKNAMPKAGGAFTGQVIAGGTQSDSVAQVRNVRVYASGTNIGSISVPSAGTIVAILK